MRLDKIFYIVISAFILTNFVIYSPIHELGDNSRYDVSLKAGARILGKNLKKCFNFTSSKLFHNTQTGVFIQLTTAQELPNFSSSYSTLNLSILSTVRLIL